MKLLLFVTIFPLIVEECCAFLSLKQRMPCRGHSNLDQVNNAYSRVSRFQIVRFNYKDTNAASSSESGIKDAFLSRMIDYVAEATQWASEFGLEDKSGAAFYALFSAIRSVATLGLRGSPFHINGAEIEAAVAGFFHSTNQLSGFFTFDDLARALEQDFLDANRGVAYTKRDAWKLTTVSEPKGSSFDDARMTLEDVKLALEKGTVIFNAAGAHIPKLASAVLACTDASSLPCAVNMYVTEAGKRTSAPPHTDRQDVIVVQTQGKKSWKIYSPPDPSLKPFQDIFSRGKVDDSLPLFTLDDGSVGSRLLIDVTLSPGDVLFVPAGFPHTTDTVNELEPGKAETTSIHLTFNFETIVWHLDYLSVRRFALRRAGINDAMLGQDNDGENQYVGKINILPQKVREDLLQHLPLGFLDEGRIDLVDDVTSELKRVSQSLDAATYSSIPDSVWRDAVEKVRVTGIELFTTHRDMYLAAIEEGRKRELEAQMLSHLTGERLARANVWTPDKIQRLSVFRVKSFYEKVDEILKSLSIWSLSGRSGDHCTVLPDDWPFSLPLKVGDKVEADLGGAFFPATVTKINQHHYDVKFFDGDIINGLERGMIKLMSPPKVDVSTIQPKTGLTKKEMKKLRNEQERKFNKKGVS